MKTFTRFKSWGFFNNQCRRQRRRSHTRPVEPWLRETERQASETERPGCVYSWADMLTRQPDEYVIVLPNLARDADAPLCRQRGRNSWGSIGSAHRDMVLDLRCGFCFPVMKLLSVNSCSLLTASREKEKPPSWKRSKCLEWDYTDGTD